MSEKDLKVVYKQFNIFYTKLLKLMLTNHIYNFCFKDFNFSVISEYKEEEHYIDPFESIWVNQRYDFLCINGEKEFSMIGIDIKVDILTKIDEIFKGFDNKKNEVNKKIKAINKNIIVLNPPLWER